MRSRYRPVSEMTRSEFIGSVAYEVGRQGAESAASFKRAFDYDLNRIGFKYSTQNPFDPVMKPIYQLKEFEVKSEDIKPFVGSGMVLLGTGILAPGAGDAAAALAGLAVFKHPIGAAVGVAIYNITGLGLVWIGYNWKVGRDTFETPFQSPV